MKNVFTVIILLFFTNLVNGQNAIGIRVGQFMGAFSDIDFPDKMYDFPYLGIPMDFQVNKLFDIRTELGYYRHGARYKSKGPIPPYDKDGFFYYDILRASALLVAEPFFFHEEINFNFFGGVGLGYYLSGNKDVIKTALFPNAELRVIKTEPKGKFGLQDSNITRRGWYTQLGGEVAYRINKNYLIAVNFTFILGLTDLDKEDIHDKIIRSYGLGASIHFMRVLNFE